MPGHRPHAADASAETQDDPAATGGSEHAAVQSGRTRVAAYALCLDEEDRILLCRICDATRDAGRWTLPGGGLEFGEPPEHAVLRELAEETGLTGRIERLATVFSRLYDASLTVSGEPVHVVGLIYRVTVEGADPRAEVDGTTDQAAWFDRASAAALPLVELAAFGLTLAGDASLRARPR